MPFVKHSDAADGGNGAATNAHDFIDNKLIPFITSVTHFPVAADRWTLEREDVIVANESEFFLSPPSNAPNAPVIAFHTKDSAVYMFGGTSYVAGTESYALPGNTRQHPESQASNPGWSDVTNSSHPCSWTSFWPTGGLTAHWLYAPSDGKYCYAVIQLAARRFRNIMFGEFNKFQSAMLGGQFFGAQHWNQGVSEIDNPFTSSRQHSGAVCAMSTSVSNGTQSGAFRAEGLRSGAPDAPAAKWHMNGDGFFAPGSFTRPTTGTWDTQNNAAEDIGTGWINALSAGGSVGSSYLFHVQQSLIANVKPLLPITVWVRGFAEAQERWMPVGQIPDLFRVSMLGFTEGQDLVVGSDTYSVLPFINSDQINTLNNDEYSAFDGLAIRQIP